MIMKSRGARRRAIGLGLALGLHACGDGDGSSISRPVPCAPDPVALPQTDVTVTLDPSQRFQTIDGFGTTQRLFDDPHVTETFNSATARAAVIPTSVDQVRILDALYRDLGLTRVRFHPEGIEAVNDNADPLSTDLSKFNFSWKAADGHIAAVRSLQARGLTTYFASPLRVESWMNESNPDEYVEWAMAMLRHWRSAGLEMPYFSLMNEPSFYGGEKSWSGAWLRDVAKRLGARLRAEKFATKLVAPDDVSPANAYARLQTILADPDARQYIGAVAYHLYDRGNEDAVAKLAKQYGIPVWMTEYSTPEDWRAWAGIMHELLATADVSAIDYMWGFFGDWDRSQLVRVKVRGSSYAGFDFNRQYYVMGQYSRYVRPGAVRIAATSSDPALKVVAFLDGARPVVVVTNLGAREHTVRFELGSAGVCGTRFEAARTSDTDAWTSLPAVTLDQPRFAAPAAAGSVTTFVGW